MSYIRLVCGGRRKAGSRLALRVERREVSVFQASPVALSRSLGRY